MKIIKRDGRIVEYKKEKIITAINKANNDVPETERASKKQIDNIIKHIEELNKKRMLVEDIQDMIETELMKIKKYELAKAYIIYRYKRALIRKSNTNDESILSLIKNNNSNETKESNLLASNQPYLISKEVSKDLTKRILLPEKIVEAHEEGNIYFNNLEYFLHPIFNSSIINYNHMLTNGTIINETSIEPAHNFLEACTILVQIIINIYHSQYGEQIINIKHLGKYLYLSEKKIKEKKLTNKNINDLLKEELIQGIKILNNQLNTLIPNNNPLITIILELDTNDKYIQYTIKIIEEIIKQNEESNNNNQNINLLYILDKNNTIKEYQNLTKLAIKCSCKKLNPYYLNLNKIKETYSEKIWPMEKCNYLPLYKNENNKYQIEGRFNQGNVTINLVQIAIIANNNEETFWNILNDRLETCYEALMCRHHTLLGTLSNVSPIHWQCGAIANLKQEEKIDKYLKNNYSILTLKYSGIKEMTEIMKNNDENFNQEKFENKIIKYLRKKCDEWKKETGLNFTVCQNIDSYINQYFLEIDRDKYGEIKNITDKKEYTNSTTINLKSKKEFEESLNETISYIDITNINEQEIEDNLPYIYNNLQYIIFKKEEEK